MDSLLTDEELYDLNADITEAADDGDVYQWERFICKAQDLKSRKVERKELVEWLLGECDKHAHYEGIPWSRNYCPRCLQEFRQALKEEP